MLPEVQSIDPFPRLAGALDAQSITPTFSYDDVARMLRVSVVTVKRWVKAGVIPQPVYVNTTARFTLDACRQMQSGLAPIGTFPRAHSPRAVVAQLAADKRRSPPSKAKPKASSLVRPTAKKTAPRRPGAKP